LDFGFQAITALARAPPADAQDVGEGAATVRVAEAALHVAA
jgi:hypothetical protein